MWTGDELLIWAGTTEPYGVGDGLLTSAAAYDPATDTWREPADSPPELAPGPRNGCAARSNCGLRRGLVDNELVILAATDGCALLFRSGPMTDGQPATWTTRELGDIGTLMDYERGAVQAWVVGHYLAIPGHSDLSWIDLDDGSITGQNLTSEQSCALAAAAAVVDDQLVGSGGWCTQISEEGSESNLFGHFLFSPPQG